MARPPKESGVRPQAYWIRPRDGGVIAFAGLMETWASADGSEVDTAAILTTAANRAIRPIHDRMPVVIGPEDFARWLDCKNGEPRHVKDLMQPADDRFFEAIPVSDLVNKVSNMGPDIQKPVAVADPGEGPDVSADGAQKRAADRVPRQTKTKKPPEQDKPPKDDDPDPSQMSLF